MSINTGVATHEGISLTFEEHDGSALDTVILAKNRQLKQVFRGPCAEALRRAEQCSYELGLDGCYEIDGTDELRARGLQGLQGMFPEVKRQIEALLPKAVKWGFDQRWSPEELAHAPVVQAQVSRLDGLRDVLMKQIADRRGHAG